MRLRLRLLLPLRLLRLLDLAAPRAAVAPLHGRRHAGLARVGEARKKGAELRWLHNGRQLDLDAFAVGVVGSIVATVAIVIGGIGG